MRSGEPIHTVRQARGDIRSLLVSAVATAARRRHKWRDPPPTDYLDSDPQGDRIATADLGGGYTMVGIGSDGGVFRYRLYTGDGIFTDGFEPAVD